MHVVSETNGNLVGAALLGLGGGLRSFAPPVALARRDLGPFRGAGRLIVVGAAVGELIADKQPSMTSRISPRGLTLRIGFSGGAGHELAGWTGSGVAAGLALAAALAGSHLRTRVSGPRARLLAAVVEDATSYALALAGASALRAADGR